MEISSCCTSRYDAGICKHLMERTGYVRLDDLIELLQRERESGCWMNLNYIEKISDYANTLCARDWRGFGRGFGVMTGVIEVRDDRNK